MMSRELGSTVMTPRVLLADDHALVLEMLVGFLRDDFTVVGTTDSGTGALEMATRLHPDLVLLELGLPGTDSLEVVRTLRSREPAVHCVFVTRHADLNHVRAAFAAGARGYVLKDATPQELVAALQRVHAGGTHVSPGLGLDPSSPPPQAITHEGSGGLTPRQIEVLRRVAEGCTGKQIASELGISLKTVESHKACISRQLGLRSTAALTRYAVEHGLVRSNSAPTPRMASSDSRG
jgi:DNA-binding NarL/FixJ family response regulator